MKTALFVLCALVAAVACSAQDEQGFGASYYAGAPGDNNQVYGSLALVLDTANLSSSAKTVNYTIKLFNAKDVTAVHLHLKGNSSDGLFGGPLLLDLTNTSSKPVSGPGPQQASTQQGFKSNSDIANNTQQAAVATQLSYLGLAQKGALPPKTASDLAALIRLDVVYTDVHTVDRVSPNGLVRSRVYITGPVNNSGK